MGEEIQQELAREYMQKAYVCYSTMPLSNDKPNQGPKQTRFGDVVKETVDEHRRLITEMELGKFQAEIDQDPRTTTQDSETLNNCQLVKNKQSRKAEQSVNETSKTEKPNPDAPKNEETD